MKKVAIDNVSVIMDDKSNLFVSGEFTVPISNQHAKDIFLRGCQSDPNHGLFLMDNGRICLSVMPDDVAKITLDPTQVATIKGLL